MEFFRAGEALLRSSQPVLPFLAPSAYRTPARLGAVTTHRRPQEWQCQQSQRKFTTSQTRQQQSAAARRDDDEAQRPAQAAPAASEDDDLFGSFGLLDRALDQDKGVPGTPSGRTSRFSSPPAQQRSRQSPLLGTKSDVGSSIDELLHGMLPGKGKQASPPTVPQRKGQGQFSSFDESAIADMLNASGKLKSNTDSGPPPATNAALVKELPFKLDSSVGRTIHVQAEYGIDIGRAFRMLEMRCAQNNVKKDFMRQRYHERPGLKRKRLKNERWRKRFKEAFQATVSRVVGMKRQGW